MGTSSHERRYIEGQTTLWLTATPRTLKLEIFFSSQHQNLSEPPPSKGMEKVDDTIRIEYAEKPSDVEGQDENEEHDKVNILELDYLQKKR